MNGLIGDGFVAVGVIGITFGIGFFLALVVQAWADDDDTIGYA